MEASTQHLDLQVTELSVACAANIRIIPPLELVGTSKADGFFPALDRSRGRAFRPSHFSGNSPAVLEAEGSVHSIGT